MADRHHVLCGWLLFCGHCDFCPGSGNEQLAHTARTDGAALTVGAAAAAGRPPVPTVTFAALPPTCPSSSASLPPAPPPALPACSKQ